MAQAEADTEQVAHVLIDVALADELLVECRLRVLRDEGFTVHVRT